jgi:DNA-binding MarR family transcriptional regulator
VRDQGNKVDLNLQEVTTIVRKLHKDYMVNVERNKHDEKGDKYSQKMIRK